MKIQKINLSLKNNMNEHFTLSLEQRGKGLWALCIGSECMDKNGKFDYEPLPSGRTASWLDQHRFSSPDKALEVFKKKLKLVVMGQHLELDDSVDHQAILSTLESLGLT